MVKRLTRTRREGLQSRIEARTPRFPLDAARAALERRWLRNYHYYNGKHFLTWNNARFQWQPDTRWKDPYIANLIRPTVQRSISKLVGQMPIPRVAPETDNVKDRSAARLAEKALLHLWDKTEFQTVTETVTTHMAVCGVGFHKVSWNPDIGPTLKFYLTPDGKVLNEVLDEEQKAQFEAEGLVKEVPAGDIQIDAVSPFAMMVDPDVIGATVDDARWICELSVQRKSSLIETYGKASVDNIAFDDTATMGLVSEQLKTEGFVGFPNDAGKQRSEDDDPQVIVKEYWEKPSTDFPEGLRVVMAGDYIIEAGENVYAKSPIEINYPYFPMRWGLDPERFWSDGLVTQLVPVQEEYNRTRTQMIENKERMANPKWMVAKGSDIPESAMLATEAEIIEFNPNFPPPQQSQPAPLPPYVSEHVQLCMNEFQILAADRDPTQAKTPSSLRSGVAIQLIDEKDRHVLASTLSSVKLAIERVARACLVLMGEFYQEPRLLKTAGENYMYEVFAFLGSDLRNNYDVRIYVESGAAESRASRQSAVLDYVQLGILNPQDPTDKRKIMKSLEVGDPSDAVTEILIDERLAEVENERMRAGAPQAVHQWYDHAVHSKVHKREMKTEAFLSSPPEVQRIFVEHLQQHEQALAQAAKAQLMIESESRGGPGQKGTASAPNRNNASS